MFGVVASAPFAMAQVVSQPYYPAITQYCPQLSYNLYQGVADYYTGGQVSQLQRFLSERGYYQPVTGYYGAITRANVAQFQSAQGIYPVTGGVGPITRASIARMCGGPVSQNTFYLNQQFTLFSGGSSTLNQGTLMVTLINLAQGADAWWNPWTPTSATISLSQSCPPGLYCATIWAPQQQVTLTQGQSTTFQGYTVTLVSVSGNAASFVVSQTNSNQSPVTITSIMPSQGPVGTQVTLYGSGFTQDNRVRFANGGAVHVPSFNNGTMLYFTIPSVVGPCDWVGDTSPIRCLAAGAAVTNGTYPISVENAYGQSNTINFVVTNTQTSNTFSANPNAGYRPLNVTFSSFISGFHPSNYKYLLDYGDGVIENVHYCPSPADACVSPGYNTHTYTDAHTYTARLLEIKDNTTTEIARTTVTVY